ncbi:hypothetical protein ACSFA8_19690 [Variovorax sp. RT4R15]|uniref:hypothetical protein n=1 Tax=Variovorax sp. RT4R15 TaxID=3443737 RepID=UPI003F461CED
MTTHDFDNTETFTRNGHGAIALTAAWTDLGSRVMVSLAGFAVGRVLLHLLATTGDRCFIFHSAGILREIPWGVKAVALFRRGGHAI